MKIREDYITVNPYSRCGRRMRAVKGVAIHGTASPRATAQNVRDYFNSLAVRRDRYAGTQFIVGLDGEIIQTMASMEVAYHVGSEAYTAAKVKFLGRGNPNNCLIGVELCHFGADGEFYQPTIESGALLAARLLYQYSLNPFLSKKVLWTHNEVVGWKSCPLDFCAHPEKWESFQNLVLENYKKIG